MHYSAYFACDKDKSSFVITEGKRGKGMAEILDVLRTEQKYRLNLQEMRKMEYVLEALLQTDAHSMGGSYLVRSLYFDTPDDRDFYEKLDGYENRKKIRLRVYSPGADRAKLELKEKQGSLQRKRSLTLDREQALRLSQGDYEVLVEEGSEFALELYGRMRELLYRPKCLVEYDRRAFTAYENDTRVTLDSNLRASECALELFAENPALYPVDPPGMGTMELKYNRFLLSYVKKAVSLPSYMQTSSSKYGAARDVLLGKED